LYGGRWIEFRYGRFCWPCGYRIRIEGDYFGLTFALELFIERGSMRLFTPEIAALVGAGLDDIAVVVAGWIVLDDDDGVLLAHVCDRSRFQAVPMEKTSGLRIVFVSRDDIRVLEE
jgi:hypothetical protein